MYVNNGFNGAAGGVSGTVGVSEADGAGGAMIGEKIDMEDKYD